MCMHWVVTIEWFKSLVSLILAFISWHLVKNEKSYLPCPFFTNDFGVGLKSGLLVAASGVPAWMILFEMGTHV